MDIASYQLYLGYFATNCSFSYRYQQIIQYQPLYPSGVQRLPTAENVDELWPLW